MHERVNQFAPINFLLEVKFDGNPSGEYQLNDATGPRTKVLLAFIFAFQHFIFSKKGEIIFDEEYCLDVSDPKPGAAIEILKCHGFGGNQKWYHNLQTVFY